MIAAIKRLLTTRRALQSDTIDSLRREVLRQSIRAVKAEDRAAYMESIGNKWHWRAEQAEAKLARIVAMETPNAAHAAKKMAAVARGEA